MEDIRRLQKNRDRLFVHVNIWVDFLFVWFAKYNLSHFLFLTLIEIINIDQIFELVKEKWG